MTFPPWLPELIYFHNSNMLNFAINMFLRWWIIPLKWYRPDYKTKLYWNPQFELLGQNHIEKLLGLSIAKKKVWVILSFPQLFRREIYNKSTSMGKWFQHFFAYNSQYIMISWILQQCWGMLVILGDHPVNIGDGYWWFLPNLLIILLEFVIFCH